MDDLIRRSDAIDAIKEFQHKAAEWRDEQEERSEIWHRADSAIASALEIGSRVKKIPPAKQWIPCEERLPEEKVAVLAYCPKYNNVWAVVRISYKWYLWHPFRHDRYDESSYGELVKWMPMPEAYKAEKE